MPKRKKKKKKKRINQKTKSHHSKRRKKRGGLRNFPTGNGSAFPFQPEPESGYHIVGPAQAMMEYSQALSDILAGESDEKEMNAILHVTGLLWNMAITDDPASESEMRTKLKSMHPDWIDDGLIDMMLDRHRRMFPTLMTDPPMAIKVHVIAPPEKIELFDESRAILKPEIIPPDSMENKVIESFHQVEERLKGGDDWSLIEKDLNKTQDKLINIFKKWCLMKGVESNVIGDLVFAAGRLMDFFHGYERKCLAEVEPEAIVNFMNDFWLRKTFGSPVVMSAMPCAIECFYRFLVEKKYTKNAELQVRVIHENRGEFLIALQTYFKPGSIGKDD